MVRRSVLFHANLNLPRGLSFPGKGAIISQAATTFPKE